MRKRVLAMLLAVTLCMGLVAAPASAYDTGDVGEDTLISVGEWHTAYIDEEGRLWTWGSNQYGQLGTGHIGGGTSKPVKVMDDVKSVSCGHSHTAAVKTDGTLWMWGYNNRGALGTGNTEDSGVPVKVMDNVAAVSCGEWHTAAIKKDGTLWTWGFNEYGHLGNGTEADSLIPVKVLSRVTAVSGGFYQSAAIDRDGHVWTWGRNMYRVLGNDEYSTSVPQELTSGAATVSCGWYNTATIATDGTLWMWGDNSYGQCGNDTKSRYDVPAEVMDNVIAVSCRGSKTAIITADGTLWMTGKGNLGNGSSNGSTSPVAVMRDVAAVSCGSHMAVIKQDGTVWTWGGNDTGQLGYESDGWQTSPKQVTDFDDSIEVMLELNGGRGISTLKAKRGDTLTVPTNPTRARYLFAGWYTDPALTQLYNFNDKVTEGFTLYARWTPISSTAASTNKSTQIITLNGNTVTLDAYVLKADSNGGDMTYVKLRDIAALLDSTKAKFNVDWRNGAIYVDTGKAYTTKNGTELKTISGTDGSYKWNTAPVLFDGTTHALEGIVITDGRGGGHTFFKLRDLGDAIGFAVGWSAERGIYIETK